MSQGTIACPWCGQVQTVSDIAAVKNSTAPAPVVCTGCNKGLSKECVIGQIQAQAKALIEAALANLKK